MVWVKGELLDTLDAPGLDPTDQLTRAEQTHLFDRMDWFRRVDAHAPDKTPMIARVASEGMLCWLFLARQGNEATGLSNWYSLAFRPVFSGEPDETRKLLMLTAIARRLASARPRIARLTLAPVPHDDGTAPLLAKAFAKGGWSVYAAQGSTSWTANVSGLSFEEYWAARPGQLRSTYKRKLAKAAFRTKVHTEFSADAWADYEAIYEQSWKPDEGAPAFLRDLAEREGLAGCLRLGICHMDGVPVAAQFWTVENGRALIHKLAHLESAREASPGTILSAAMFAHVIDEDRVGLIDFGTGNDAYKADWMDGSAPLITIRAFNNRTLAGLVGAAKSSLSRLVRRPPSD
jgi:Acetyltransferase (GNAT) domain